MKIDYAKQSQEIVKQIQEAEKLGKPIVELVKRHIDILQAYHDDFVKQADAANINNIERARFEVKINMNIKAWANKIGLPVEKYDEAIKKVNEKFFGEAEKYIKFIPNKK